MPIDYQTLPHTGIRQLTPYKPGKSIEELAKEKGLSQIIKLASNENPRGCSPKVKQELSGLSASVIATYPSATIHPLRAHLAEHLDLSPEYLMLSNGSDYIYGLLLSCFALHQNKHLLTHDYAFSTYEIQAKALGVEVCHASIGKDWEVDVRALIKSCTKETGLICLANPNNPTGRLIPAQDIKWLIERTPEQTLIVLDEAYFEYSKSQQGYDAIEWLETYPNLILTRTFSKVYGLAGLRLGYAIGNPSILSLLIRLQLPFTVNQAALNAGVAALSDQDFVSKTLALNQEGMIQMSAGLEALGLDYIPSSCNFISFNCRQDGLAVYEQLLNQGIIVRPLHPYNMPNYLRVSIGTKEQNARFLKALRGVYE